MPCIVFTRMNGNLGFCFTKWGAYLRISSSNFRTSAFVVLSLRLGGMVLTFVRKATLSLAILRIVHGRNGIFPKNWRKITFYSTLLIGYPFRHGVPLGPKHCCSYDQDTITRSMFVEKMPQLQPRIRGFEYYWQLISVLVLCNGGSVDLGDLMQKQIAIRES